MLKKHIRAFVICASALLAVICPLTGMSTAYAAETAIHEAEIPVSFPQTGGTAEIEEDSENSKTRPEPILAEKSISVQDGKSGSFLIRYEEPGIFRYVIRQTTDKKDGVTYDNTVYNVTLYITSRDDGTLTHEINAFKNDSISKTDKISFVNKKQEEKKTVTPESKKAGKTRTDDTADASKWAIITAASACALIITLVIRRHGNKKDARL